MLLKGSDNSPEWELAVYTTFLAKDLSEAVDKDLSWATDIKQTRKNDKAFALIIQSLSPVIQASLSTKARDFRVRPTKILWDELRAQYSASTGARKAALLRETWTLPVAEGKNPMTRVSAIRSAHTQIHAHALKPDELLAYAMAMCLPESYLTLQQALWTRPSLSSTEVQATIHAEWLRRQSDPTSALLAKFKSLQGLGQGQKSRPHCNHCNWDGHTQDRC